MTNLEAIVDDIACRWYEDEDGNWFTGCGEAFIISEGTPTDNGMKFCCFCGKPLEEAPYKDKEDESDQDTKRLDWAEANPERHDPEYSVEFALKLERDLSAANEKLARLWELAKAIETVWLRNNDATSLVLCLRPRIEALRAELEKKP